VRKFIYNGFDEEQHRTSGSSRPGDYFYHFLFDRLEGYLEGYLEIECFSLWIEEALLFIGAEFLVFITQTFELMITAAPYRTV